MSEVVNILICFDFRLQKFTSQNFEFHQPTKTAKIVSISYMFFIPGNTFRVTAVAYNNTSLTILIYFELLPAASAATCNVRTANNYEQL